MSIIPRDLRQSFSREANFHGRNLLWNSLGHFFFLFFFSFLFCGSDVRAHTDGSWIFVIVVARVAHGFVVGCVEV